VAREDVERRAAGSTRARCSVVTLAAHFSRHDVIAQANPALDRPFGFLVVGHRALGSPQVAGRNTPRSSSLHGSVRKLLLWGLAEAGAAGGARRRRRHT